MNRSRHAGDRLAGLAPAHLSLFVVILGMLVLIPAAQAAAGDLDPSYGTNGKVVSNLDAGTIRAGALQPDGKLVVAVGGSFGFGAARYKTDGTLDPTFSGDGQTATDFGPGSESAAAIALQGDGKIVVGGSAAPGGFCCAWALARYNVDGSLDATFGADGILTTAFGGGGGVADIVVQPDGKIVAAGGIFSPFGDSVAIARYSSDGSLDSTFDADGMLTTDFGGPDTASSVVLQPDGKIVIAGSGGSNDFILARYHADGSLDSSFHADGKVTTDFALPGAPLPSFDRAEDVVLLPDGRIVAGGSGRERFALARYEPDGDLDPSFDSDGKVTTQFLGLNIESAYGLELQPDGMLVVAGRVFTTTRGDFAVARYDLAGGLDLSFGGGDGFVTTDFPETIASGSQCPGGQPTCSDDIALDVALQSNGRIVAIGGGGPCTPNCVSLLARYEGYIVSDVTPPLITVPASVVADATGPNGAVVAYAASAVDDVDGPVAVTCEPPSGSMFAIGTTSVACTASDAAGNDARTTFDVHVKGAREQVDDLIALVTGLGPGASLADKLQEARGALVAGQKAEACEKLTAFTNQALAQSGKKLTPDEASQLVAAATRIGAVIDC